MDIEVAKKSSTRTRRTFLKYMCSGAVLAITGCGGSSSGQEDDTETNNFPRPEEGRHVYSYRWNSPFGGNDWCFVRTPPNYSDAGTAHPLVIFRHGNGWVMNGSQSTANFSRVTQFGVDSQNDGEYLDTTREDYSDYSSPLIEAFLAAGFVVCGCQNNGAPEKYDAGYGNLETQRVADLFFDHIQQNYNVESWCHMVGASNGAIAVLDAARFMGPEKVRSITLLYPLINLKEAWSSSYTYDIAAAHDIDEPLSEDEFERKAAPHDPMEADASEFPPILCRWSLEDTVLDQKSHWLAFEGRLQESELKYVSEQVQGDHGDYRHFEGVDGDGVKRLVDWAKLNNQG